MLDAEWRYHTVYTEIADYPDNGWIPKGFEQMDNWEPFSAVMALKDENKYGDQDITYIPLHAFIPHVVWRCRIRKI